MSGHQQQTRNLALQVPVIVLVVAFTAVPLGLRPLSRAAIAQALNWHPRHLDVEDIVVNVAGYVVVGVLVGGRSAPVAIGLASALSLLTEIVQLLSVGRSPSIIDFGSNSLGAAIGVGLAHVGWGRPLRLPLTRRTASLAGALAGVYVASVVYAGAGSPTAMVTTLVSDVMTGRLWMTTNPRGHTVPGGLEGQWTFDDGEDDTAVDASGHGLTGRIVHAAALVPDSNGRVLRLNGTDQYVDLGSPDALQVSGSMTVSAWIHQTAFPVDDAAIVSSVSGFGYQLDTTIDEGRRTLGFKLSDASGRLMARYGNTPLERNQWYHVAGVYDAASRTLHAYVNGQLDDGCLVGDVTSSQHPSGRRVVIGRRADSTGFEFAGLLDDVRVYSSAISSHDIAEMARVPEGRSRQFSPTAQTQTEVASHRSDLSCESKTSVDRAMPGLVACFGFLLATAIVGYSPTASPWATGLGTGVVAGALLLAIGTPVFPQGEAWLIPLLTCAGSLSVAISARRET